MPADTHDVALMSVKSLTTYMGVSRATLYRSLFPNESFPKPVALSRSLMRFRRKDIDAWVKSLKPVD